MYDRQYWSSLMLSVAGLVAVLAGLAAVPFWLGWAGAAALAAAAGGCLTWFYWGPRSDVLRARPADPRVRSDDD